MRKYHIEAYFKNNSRLRNNILIFYLFMVSENIMWVEKYDT